MQAQGWRRRVRALATVGWRPLIAALLIAPALSLAVAEPAMRLVSAQDVGTEDFESPRYRPVITVRDNGAASPYDSTVEVTGMDGRIVDVNLILRNVSHQRPEDISVMLSHAGRSTVVMRQAGGETAIEDTNIVLDDDSNRVLQNNDPIVGNRAYQPRDYDANDTPFGGGAPTSNDAGGEYLDFFDGVTANGDWTLWVRDDQSPIPGTIGGWQLEIVTDNADPFIAKESFTVKQGSTLRVSEEDGVLRHVQGRGNFEVTVENKPDKGKLKLREDGSFTYEAGGNKKGNDSFTYTIQDEFGTSIDREGEVNIKIKKDKDRKKKNRR